MDVLNPAFCRTRRLTMTSNAEDQANPPAAATVQPPKATKLANVAPRKRRVAPAKPRSAKKASSAERRPKSQKAAKQGKPAAGAREGSKAAKVLGLLRRPDGASLKELMKATGWLAHAVRGYLTGTVSKRLGLKLVSAKNDEREAPLYRPKVARTIHLNKEPPGHPRRLFFVRFQVGPEALSHERLRSFQFDAGTLMAPQRVP
jgi:hypothetical protein